MPASVQLKDNYLLTQLETERNRHRDPTLVRTATRLLTERLAQLDYDRRQQAAQDPATQKPAESTAA